MNDIAPEPGQVWLSRYTTGVHVAITEADGRRVRLAEVTVTADGGVALRVGRGRWVSIRQLTTAYRLTDHRLETQ